MLKTKVHDKEITPETHLLENPSGEPEHNPAAWRFTYMRWVFLVFACFINFGAYYAGGVMTALQEPIQKKMDLNNKEYNVFFSISHLPNIVLPLLGGLIFDYVGVRLTIMLYSVLIVGGQFLLWFGVLELNYATIVAARAIGGIGYESLQACKSAIVARWFRGKELAFALGMTLAINRCGSSLDNYLTTAIYDKDQDDVAFPILVSCYFCLFSFVCAIVLCMIDWKAEKIEGKVKAASQRFQWRQLKSMRRLFWILLLLCCLYYGSFNTFLDNLNDLLVQRFGFNVKNAGSIMAIIFLGAAFFTPAFGIMIDKWGKRVIFLQLNAFVLILTYCYVAFLNDSRDGNPVWWVAVGFLGMSFFYAAYGAVIWPSLPLVIEERVVGTAFGITLCWLNVIQAIIPVISGAIHDATEHVKEGYFWPVMFLNGILLLGFATSIWVFLEDRRTGGVLEKHKVQKDSDVRRRSSSFIGQGN